MINKLPRHHGLKTGIWLSDRYRPGVYVDRTTWDRFSTVCKNKYGVSKSKMIRGWIVEFLEKETS
jgi:hypothetical protein